MKAMSCAIVLAVLLLSAVLCEPDDESYAKVKCDYLWGETICDCENLKYVMTVDPYVDRKFFIQNFSTIFSSCDCRLCMETFDTFT